MQVIRRVFLILAAAAALLSCATLTPPDTPPIIFVHGNGDSAALWTTTLWRFESNGWPRDRLVAINMPYPTARDDNTKPQQDRSSTEDQMRTLAAEVARVLKATGAKKVVLIGNSRGGNAIRSYIQDGGGVDTVSHAILGGTPNHGIWAIASYRPNNEFNGAGPYLMGLNAPKGPDGDEATPGVKWMTIRSNNNDKYAQPDGIWIGAPGTATNVTYAGPALKGATNVVLDARDHHEVSFHPEAFVPAYRFITGRDPANPSITPESSVVLDGIVTGTGPGGPTNLPLESAMVEVYATDANTGERRGVPLRTVTVGVDGRWGPLTVDPGSPLEFVVTAAGYAVHHVYRSPFPRSSSIVHLRPEKLLDSDRSAASVVTFVRPRGYFGLPRDQIVFDNRNPAPGIPTGVAGVASSRMALSSAERTTVVGDYKSGVISERVVGRTWPVANNQLATLELHY